MKTAKQSKRQAKQLFRLCRVNGALDEGRVRQAAAKIVESRRRGYLTLLANFLRLVKLEQERHTAEVQSAAPLAPDLQASVQVTLHGLYGKGINILFAERPELIGGMRIKVGSEVYDGSVQSRLAAIEKAL